MNDLDSRKWSLDMAIQLCHFLEALAPKHGYHIGLTGGTLFKDGPRKDVDILIYEIRQNQPCWEGFLATLQGYGFSLVRECGWVKKLMSPHGRAIDFLFPETPKQEEGDYPE